MGLNLDRLLFDPASATDGPLVGSYLLASDGTALTHSTVGGKQSLDVNVANSITATVTQTQIWDGTDYLAVNADGSINATVSATNLDVRNLTAARDTVKVSDGTNALAVTAGGAINAVVTASNLDIRNLSTSRDVVKIGDGTNTLVMNADGSINANLTDDGVADGSADSGNPFKMGGHAYSGALSAAASGSRVNLAQDLYRRTFINDAPSVGALTQAITVGTSAVALPSAALAGRTRILIQNNSANPVYIGHSSVTTANGIHVAKGGTMALELGQSVSLYAIAGTAGNEVRVLEMG